MGMPTQCQLQASKPSASRRDLESITAEVAALVKRQVGSDVDPHLPLMEAGLDSLGAVELRSALSSAFYVELPATLTFDHPTVAALGKHLATIAQPLEDLVLSYFHSDVALRYRLSLSSGDIKK